MCLSFHTEPWLSRAAGRGYPRPGELVNSLASHSQQLRNLLRSDKLLDAVTLMHVVDGCQARAVGSTGRTPPLRVAADSSPAPHIAG